MVIGICHPYKSQVSKFQQNVFAKYTQLRKYLYRCLVFPVSVALADRFDE